MSSGLQAPASSGPSEQAFPVGGGELGALIRQFDWAATELGPISGWSPALRTATNIVLQSPLPLVMLWGPNGIMIYNDAYSVFAGKRHPRLLGSKVLEGWAEVADFNARVLEVGLAGGTLSFKNQELTLYRNNAPEQVWMDLNYGPVLGDDDKPAGVLAIVVETTGQVKAEQALAAERAAVEQANLRLTAESAFLQELFENAPSFMTMLSGPEHQIVLMNAGYRRLIGGRDVLGLPLAEALPEVVEQGFIDILDRVVATGEAYVGAGARVQLQRQAGGPLETRVLDFVYQPISTPQGLVTGVFVEGQDVTERAEAEAQVHESEKRFRALVNAISDVVYRMSPDWRELRRLDGRGFLTDADGPSVTWMDEYLFPEDQALVMAAVEEAIRNKGVFQLEHRVRQADGSVGWTLSRAVPLLNEAGEIVEWFGAASDVTARKEAEEHLRLIINELNHRVKNTLAMMQAIAAQTFRNADDIPQAQEKFTARIMALAKANDLLTGEHWVGASLRDVVRMSLDTYFGGEPDRYELSGPLVRLSPKTALSLSMALHELATNATKYGAGSNKTGRIVVTWTLTPAAGEERLRLTWRETGGPPVAPPPRRGFGSRLIERGLAAELGGEVRLDFAPEGLTCVIDAPLLPQDKD